MAQTISKIGIKNSTGTGYDTRDIGAKGQNVEIGYDSDGKIIADVDTTTPASTKTLTQTLQDLSSGAGDEKADNYHAWTDSDTGVDHGKASATQYGHMKVGTGLSANNGTVSVSYGTTSDTACAGNDSRLSDTRKNPNAVTFTTSAGDGAGSYDGSASKTVGYGTVGAAPAGHTSIAASSSTLGHVQTSTGLTNSSGTISVTYGTAAGTACVGNDSRLSDSRTPKAHATTSTTYGGGTASNYGHVKLVDTYAVDTPSAASNGAATSIAASAYALQQAYSTLNSNLGDLNANLTHRLGSQTLTAGSTTLTWTDALITDTCCIDVYCDTYGVSPSSQTQSGTTLTLTFKAQTSDINVDIVIIK